MKGGCKYHEWSQSISKECTMTVNTGCMANNSLL